MLRHIPGRRLPAKPARPARSAPHLDVSPVAHVLRNFNMWGHTMPDFKNRMQLIAEHAGCGPGEHLHQVVEAVVRYWDIEQPWATLAKATASLYGILAYQRRIDRRVGRSHGALGSGPIALFRQPGPETVPQPADTAWVQAPSRPPRPEGLGA